MFLNETRARVSERCLRHDALIIQSKGEDFLVLVDPEDYEKVEAVGPWHIQRSRNNPRWPVYVARNLKHPTKDNVWTRQLLHHFILGVKGIDHINGLGTDNRRCNLRVLSHGQNLQNYRLSKHNTTGCRGVRYATWARAKRKWAAGYRLAGKDFHVGVFDTRREACAAVRAARQVAMPYANEARNICRCQEEDALVSQ